VGRGRSGPRRRRLRAWGVMCCKGASDRRAGVVGGVGVQEVEEEKEVLGVHAVQKVEVVQQLQEVEMLQEVQEYLGALKPPPTMLVPVV